MGNITNYTITNLTNGQKYYFAVSAINGLGEGPWSNEVSATPTAEQQQQPGKTPGFDLLVGICAIAVNMAVIAIRRRKSGWCGVVCSMTCKVASKRLEEFG